MNRNELCPELGAGNSYFESWVMCSAERDLAKGVGFVVFECETVAIAEKCGFWHPELTRKGKIP